MPATPNMRVLVTTMIDEDGHHTSTIHRKPYAHATEGGPPDIIQHLGVTQVIVIRETPASQTTIYSWVELKLIPDPEMNHD